MATNLRLGEDAEQALRREAERTGRSQQEIIREAVDRHLGLRPPPTAPSELDRLVEAGELRRPRSAYRRAATRLRLRIASEELLERGDRF